MARACDIVTFDCYGTLIDWEGGISRAFAVAAAAAGRPPVERARVLALHEEIEPIVQAEGFRPYREVLAETAWRIASRLGWELTPQRATFLADSLPGWPAFDDTNAALERLAGAGYRLGILSNVDDDLLAATREHFSVSFDLIVTAQQVRSYKPAHGHFLEARERVGDARWLHAARSYFHDVEPCRKLGIRVAWINRGGSAPTGEVRPDRELRDLRELADWLA